MSSPLPWFKFVKIPSFTIRYRGTRGPDLDACFGMIGCLLWIALEDGLADLTPLLLMCWRVVWGSYVQDGLNGWSASDEWVAGVRSGVLGANPDVWTGMEVWFGMRFLVFVVVVLVCLLLHLGLAGLSGLGGI